VPTLILDRDGRVSPPWLWWACGLANEERADELADRGHSGLRTHPCGFLWA
jgi:hypothetical protein